MAEYLETYAGASPPGRERRQRRRASTETTSGYVVTAGDAALRGGQRRRRDGRLPARASGGPRVRRRARPRDRAAPLRATTAGPSSCATAPVLVVGASHSGGDIAYEVAKAGFPTLLSGPDTGQFPLDIESRCVRLGAPAAALRSRRGVLTVSTPLGRKAQPADPRARRTAAAREARRPRGGGRRARARPHVGVARRHAGARRRDGSLDVANVVWCTGFRTRLRLDPVRGSRRGRRLSRAEARRGRRLARPVLRRAALPALVQLDADPRRRARRRGVAEHIAARARVASEGTRRCARSGDGGLAT